MPSATGSAPPERPVPAPRATNGIAVRGAGAHDRLHLLGRLGQADEPGDHPPPRQPVALVRAQLLVLGEHGALRQRRCDGLGERPREPHACQSMPMATTLPAGVEVLADAGEAGERILTPEALAFVATLQRELGPRRAELLERRDERQAANRRRRAARLPPGDAAASATTRAGASPRRRPTSRTGASRSPAPSTARW